MSHLQLGQPLGLFHPEVHLYTDSSQKMWGAFLPNYGSVSESWHPDWEGASINVLELQAVFQALLHFKSYLQGKRVQIVTDNMTALYYLNKQGGTRQKDLLSISRDLLLWAHAQGMSL